MKSLNSKSHFHSQTLALSISILLLQLLSLAKAQSGISTPCTSTMLSSFTPCLSYITGSSSNGTSPTADCCSSLKALMAGSMDCACLLVTASVPLPSIVNRNLAISLPRACQSSVPIKCQASGSPLPAPGPAQFGPPPSPSAFTPQASKAAARDPEAAPAPEPPASPPADVESPPAPVGLRPVLTTSGSIHAYTNLSPVGFMLIFAGLMMALRLY